MIDVKEYFKFKGRSNRSEYWAINLLSYFGLIVVGLLSAVVAMSGILGALISMGLIVVACVAVVWLVIAVTVRRCRDIGITPWFTLALLIPYIALIPFIVFGCLNGEVAHEHTCH